MELSVLAQVLVWAPVQAEGLVLESELNLDLALDPDWAPVAALVLVWALVQMLAMASDLAETAVLVREKALAH